MLLLVWVGALQVMLDTGKEADWFSSPAIVVECIVAIIGFLAWVIWELTEKNPIVDLSLFRNRNFALGTLVFCLGYAVFFGNNVLLPVWLQTQVGYVATWAGLVVAPAGVVAVFITPLVARALGKVDARLLATVAMSAFGISFWMRSGFTQDANFIAFMLPNLVMGVAMATFFVSMVTINLNGVTGAQVPAASGLTNFARITAGSFAASLVTTIQDRGGALHQTRLSEVVTSTNPILTGALEQLQQAGLSVQQSIGAVTGQFARQAYLLATIDIFRASAWLCFASIPLIWLTSRARPSAGAPPPAAD
jgi:DHA2 family multidrug resistance protein